MTDEPTTELTLADILVAAAEELAGVGVLNDRDGATWSVGSIAFATLSGPRAEFRLDPIVAQAVLRTSDTAASARGGDWVSFAPVVIDDEAVDRAEAWFLAAHRRAMKGRG